MRSAAALLRLSSKASHPITLPSVPKFPSSSASSTIPESLPPRRIFAFRTIFSQRSLQGSMLVQRHKITQGASSSGKANLVLAKPWNSAQSRAVTFLRATHAHGEKQGCYNDIKINVTNFSNEDKGTIELAGDVFDVPIRKDIVHRVVVWQLAKRRQGTHSTKTISEVSGTGRKPYKQKGTGNARHGSLRGPQFRHGATMHGPKPRDYSYNLPKKIRRLGLKIALSARVAEGKLLVLEDVVPESHKTKEMAKYIAGLDHCKRALIVDGADKVNTLLCRSTNNLYEIDVIPAKGLNVYSILQHDTLIMSVDAIRYIENRMHTPINR